MLKLDYPLKESLLDLIQAMLKSDYPLKEKAF